MSYKKPYTIEELQAVADKHGGKCLSKVYVNSYTKLQWECSKGHIWEAVPVSIKHRGSWCPKCCRSRKPTIEEIKEFVGTKWNGQCLSDKYENISAKLKFRCKSGHIWESNYRNIRRGHWCARCYNIRRTGITRQRLTIDEMCSIATKRGGKCLSTGYINCRSLLEWECAEGHVWKASARGVKNSKTWCPECAANRKLNLSEMKALAKSKGGKCLSKEYVNVNMKLKWQCKTGHEWEAKPHDIKTYGHWCRACALGLRTIEEMKAYAEGQGGKCLSKTYKNFFTKLKWECDKGHRWDAIPSNILNGRWCPVCNSRKLDIKDLKLLAKDRGGKLLSKDYKDCMTKVEWQCKEGHIWKATANGIKNDYWCPECGGTKKLTIGMMQKIAASKGGKCLSKEYINIQNKLSWICKEGHEWESTASLIRSGHWCPICAKKCIGHEIQKI